MEAAEQALAKLEGHSEGPIPTELVTTVIGLLPQIIELLGRKVLRRQVAAQGKLIQLILQKNEEQDARIAKLEQK